MMNISTIYPIHNTLGANNQMYNTRLFTILGFIFFGILTRFIPHPPNVTAMNAIALFGSWSIGNLPLSILVLFMSMGLSDLAIGFHPNMFAVYLSYGLIVLMGRLYRNERSWIKINTLLIASSLLFFVITNFGEWLTNPLYPKTFVGMALCYFAGIPFLVNDLVGTLFYGVILFGSYRSYQEFTNSKHFLSN